MAVGPRQALGRTVLSQPLYVGGVGKSWVFTPHGCSQPTSLAFLVTRFPHISEADWRERMAAGLVSTEAGQAICASSPCVPGQRISYFRHVKNEVTVPFEAHVLYLDQRIVVADKPHFLPTVPSGAYVQETLLARLRTQLDLPDLAPMHRLDRDTAGVVLFSIQPASRRAYHSVFKDRLAVKTYEAIAPWRAGDVWPQTRMSRMETSAHFMQMHEVSGPANTETRIDLIEYNGTWARYRLHPKTGKRHQLRLHMASVGLPILNDGIYPTLTPKPSEGGDPNPKKKLQLLAKSLAFTDPITGCAHCFESQQQLDPLPAV